MSNNKESFSISKRLESFTYAFNGIRTLFSTEHNAWIHLVAALTVMLLGKFFGLSNYEWCLIAIAIGLVFIAEIINTAIEKLTDMISPQYSESAKKVKDLAAGGVLIAAFVAVIIGVFVFGGHLSS